MSTKVDIEALAGIVAREAAAKDVALESRVEALKELNRFYDILCKAKGGTLDPPPADGASFVEFRKDVKDPAHGAAKSTDA